MTNFSERTPLVKQLMTVQENSARIV